MPGSKRTWLKEEDKRLSKKLEETNKEVVALMEIPSIINSALSVYDLLSTVMNSCRTVVGSTTSALYICDEETEKLAVSF